MLRQRRIFIKVNDIKFKSIKFKIFKLKHDLKVKWAGNKLSSELKLEIKSIPHQNRGRRHRMSVRALPKPGALSVTHDSPLRDGKERGRAEPDE